MGEEELIVQQLVVTGTTFEHGNGLLAMYVEP